MNSNNRSSFSLLSGLTATYVLVFLFSAFEPSSRAVWIAEIIPAIAILVLIWLVSRQFQFSKTAYCLMFIWLTLHTIGAKYTFAGTNNSSIAKIKKGAQWALMPFT